MEQSIAAIWYGPSAPLLLQPFAALYGLGMRLRSAAYARGWLSTGAAPCPVVVIGNLTVGGTGKTPLVIWLARRLRARGVRVGIVARGHGSSTRPAAPAPVSAQSRWEDVGDEAVLLHARSGCPTRVGRDRLAAARSVAADGAELILADDGLQHLALRRDCEIMVIDGSRGFGNGSLLPAGPLREPVSRVAGADLIVLNGAAEHPSLRRVALPADRLVQMQLVPGQAYCLDAQPRAPLPLASFAGEPIHAIAGIGNPQRFFRELRDCGLEPIEHAFPDHHPFAAADLEFGDARPILMTEKDAVKCRAFADPRMWVVPVEPVFAGEGAARLENCVLARLGKAAPAAEGA